jgi:hypothetical protein
VILVSRRCATQGFDIRYDMAAIYSLMGVCPQHDLLWEQLTAREHLLFYGRLKNLKARRTTIPTPPQKKRKKEKMCQGAPHDQTPSPFPTKIWLVNGGECHLVEGQSRARCPTVHATWD